MKKVLFVITFLLAYSTTWAQNTDTELKKQALEHEKNAKKIAVVDSLKLWKTGGVGSLTFSQVSLTNWQSGGDPSMAFGGLFTFFANYKRKNLAWDSKLDVAYGQIKQGELDMRKSDDKIDLSSKFGYKASEKMFYSVLYNFKSQMTPGYNYAEEPKSLISDILAPASMVFSAGIDYKMADELSIFASPVTGKTTIVANQKLSEQGLFGVEANKMFRAEFGGFLKIQYKKELLKNVILDTKADFFTNYLNDPQYVDVSWEALVALKVNKYLSANLHTHLIYDYDVIIPEFDEPRIQFKEVFGVGFSYKF